MRLGPPQFEGLEKIHQDYKERGVTVLGMPCNQFANQEPETDATMAETCKRNHGVTFQLTRKVLVNGADAHPLWKFLKEKTPGFLGFKNIKWNFTKFLVSPDGKTIKRYAPTTPPNAIVKDLEKMLVP